MIHTFLIPTAAVVLVLIAATTDIRWRRIPNWLTQGGMAGGLLLGLLSSGLAGLERAAAGMVLGFAAYFILYCLHAMGAGDVKLWRPWERWWDRPTGWRSLPLRPSRLEHSQSL